MSEYREREMTVTYRLSYTQGGPTMMQALSAALDGRPVAVIDPEDRQQVGRLVALCNFLPRVIEMQAALREFANPTPPRPDEPGTWGVVEASCCHRIERVEWVKHPDGNWWPVTPYSKFDPTRAAQPDDWSDLVDPTLIREGVQ